MTKTKTIHFDEMRQLLSSLGYIEKSTDKAHIFHQAGQNLIVFRRYRDHEQVNVGDVVSTRLFLDSWGILEASDFDAFMERHTTTA